MSLKIRLLRGGKKGFPAYKIVVADSKSPRDGKHNDVLGHYQPALLDESKRVNIYPDKLKYWIGVGAVPTDRVVILASKISDCKDLVSKFRLPQRSRNSKSSPNS